MVFDTDAGLQGFNLFVYCGNNPISRIDTSGADSEDFDGDAEDTSQKEAMMLGPGGNGKGVPNPSGSHISSDKVSQNTRKSSGTLTSKASPISPERIDKKYIDRNNIDAHAFKNQAGKVPRNQLSRYDIYKDTSNKGKLWVGLKNGTGWRETIYFFSELVESWGKNGR